MSDLTTLAAVKQYLKIPDAQTAQDELLESLITASSAAIEKYLGRTLEQSERTQVSDGTGSARMMFADWPVSAVESVTIDGQAIPAATSVTASGYRFDSASVVLNGYRFSRGLLNVTLAYTAGYAVIPADIAQACIETVALTYRRAEHIDVSSKALAGESITYIVNELSPAVRQMLGPYKKVIPI